MPNNGSPVRLHPDNPRYLLYRGKPLVLITASEHYGAVLNRNFDYVRYLNEAADKAMTNSRCFLLFRELEGLPHNPHSPCKPVPADYVAPFKRTGPGYAPDGYPRFDLDQWDDEYFTRLHDYLSEASRRGIVVELTLFSNSYGSNVWELNPFNIKNNVNGVGDIAWQSYTSMLDEGLFARQAAYVRKVVREVNAYDNLYFEICNEPFGDHPGHASVEQVVAWHDALRGVIREEEARLPKRHLVFQVPVEAHRMGSELDGLADNSDVDAINLHDYHWLYYRGQAFHQLGRFMQKDTKLRGIQHLWTTCHAVAKPLMFDEDNAATNARDEQAWTLHRKRAWTTVCSGGHYDMIDFSIQAGGGEAGTPASRATIRTWLKHLSTFIHGIDFIHATPVAGFCAGQPRDTWVSVLANPGREYVLYVADAREVDAPGAGQPISGTLSFALPKGRYRMRCYSPERGEYIGREVPVGDGTVNLPLEPFVQDVVVHIVACESVG
mgnify:CR=1 FL=1